MAYQSPLLVIDDNPDDRFALRRLLKHFAGEFPEVLEFESCEAALAYLEEHPALCCLVDYHLPGMDGLDFLKALRQSSGNELLPVVVLTGQGDEALAVSMLQSGAQDYLVKGDISGEKVYRAIKTAIKSCELQRQLHYLAHYDALTGLLNRSLFMDRLQQVIGLCDRYQKQCALLYLDVDGFKEVNDSMGHEAGDFLLQTVAQRLQQNCRKTDSPARLGGDEFVVLLDHVAAETSQKIAQKILRAIEQPVVFHQHVMRVSTSIGIAQYPDTAKSANELLKQADQAMYLAKRSGRAQWVQFSPDQSPDWQRRDELRSDLPRALENGEFQLRCEPLVELASGQARRLRIASRWRHERYQLEYPELIRMLERQGLVEAYLDWWSGALKSQLDAQADWFQGERLPLQIPANHCLELPLLEQQLHVLTRCGVGADATVLEFGETALMRHPENSTNLLDILKARGIGVVMAGVGGGYSAIGWLTKLPLKALMLDKSLLGDGDGGRAAAALVALGHSLGLEIVAHGVDDAAQEAAARNSGCDLVVGDLYQWQAGQGLLGVG